MSTPIQQIRSLTQDLPVLVDEILELDGVQKSARLTYFPVPSASVIITPTPTTIDEQSGLLTWATAPVIGEYAVRYSFVCLLDATIQDFIDLEDSDQDIRVAAASALDAIATSQAVILKKIDLLDLKTDGPALAKALREHAAILRQLVFSPDFVESTFDIAEQINDTYGYREKVLKDYLRLWGGG